MSDYCESVLLRNSQIVLPLVLLKMEKDLSQVSEIKLTILQRLLPGFQFKHAQKFVSILEAIASEVITPNGNILLQSNPLMWLVICSDLLI